MGANAAVQIDKHTGFSEMLGLTAETQLQDELGIIPVSNGKIIEELRDTYRKAVEFHPMWLHSGGRDEVAADALYVGHYRNRYVWVTADGLEGFTDFAIRILTIAAGEEKKLLFTF
jgi:hypothetical protein